jgi:GntR family transcriptional regulator/MocR family aminotransferase
MCQRYDKRRRALLDAVRELLPALRLRDDPAGLHETVQLPASVDEPALLAAAARRGVGLEGLSRHRHASHGRPGLLAGYGNLSEPALKEAVRRLADAFAEVTASGPARRRSSSSAG